jgi:hypothetical protein
VAVVRHVERVAVRSSVPARDPLAPGRASIGVEGLSARYLPLIAPRFGILDRTAYAARAHRRRQRASRSRTTRKARAHAALQNFFSGERAVAGTRT